MGVGERSFVEREDELLLVLPIICSSAAVALLPFLTVAQDGDCARDWVLQSASKDTCAFASTGPRIETFSGLFLFCVRADFPKQK